MKVFHYVAVFNKHDERKRFAWHYSSQEKLDPKRIESFLIKARVNNTTNLGLHKLSTESKSWQSIVDKDTYFVDIDPIEDEAVFFKRITD